MKTIGFFTLSFFTVLFVSTQPAYAYLDPGTGSFILQMLVAGFMSALFTIKLYWFKVKAFIAKLMGKELPVSSDDESDDEDLPSSEKKLSEKESQE